MEEKYRVNGENGSYIEYPNIESVPEGQAYTIIPIEPISNEKVIRMFMPELQKIFTENRFKAQKLVIDKQGSEEYISAQRESYENKYRVAKGEIANEVVLANLQIEANDLGISMSDLKLLIISKYEVALSLYQHILALNESCRTRIQTCLEQGHENMAKDCLELYRNIVATDIDARVTELMSV